MRLHACCRSENWASQVINASERQLCPGLTHLEISFRKERQERENGGKREEVEEEMLLHPLPDKQKLRAFNRVEQGSGGEGK